MLSTQELLSVISGRSSLTDPKSVEIEINRMKPIFEEGLDYYKPPSSSSVNKLKSSSGIKRKEFILKLSKFLDLDELQTNELFQNYLRITFRGSGPQLQAILKQDTQLETFLLKVCEFYFKERNSLLACLKYLITYWQDETCLYREEFMKIVDLLASSDIIKKITTQLKDRFKKAANFDAIKGYPSAVSMFSMQIVKEQCYLAEIIFLYYKDFDMPLHAFLDLANFFRCQNFGASQVNRKYFPQQVEALINRFGYLSSMILLEGLDLELLRKLSCEDDRSDVSEHHLVEGESWKEIDKLLYTWDDLPQQAPILMAYTVFRQLCLPSEEQELTKLFGNAALRCNIMNYLHEMMMHELFDKPNDPIAGLVKSFVYVLLSIMLTIFHEQSLGDYQTLIFITCKAVSNPHIASIFWAQDQSYGVSILLNAAKKRFPAMVCPYIDLLSKLCASKDIADYVFHEFEQLNSFTELFGKNSVSEIEACDEKNIWRRTSDRVVMKYKSDYILLPAGVSGKVVQYKEDIRLVRWNYSYSGWLYALLQLNDIAADPMTWSSDSGEDGFSVVKSIVNLCSAMIKYDVSKAEEMEPIIATIFKLIQRFSQLLSPPLDVLAACLQCLQLIIYQIPIQIWEQILKMKFLPSQKMIILKTRSETSLQLLPGFYGTILSKHEVPSGKFSVTKEYLKLILDTLNSIFIDEVATNISLINDFAINIMFVVKEIFASFNKWRYYQSGDKEVIGQMCLEIFHAVLSPNFMDIAVSDNKTAPSLKAIVREGLLYHNAAASLVSVLSIGVDGIENLLFDSARQNVKIVQLVKLSCAVINQLCSGTGAGNVSPLEEALCHHYVQQTPDIDFLQETNKVTLLSVIAKYIFHRQDPKLPILAMIVLRSLAAKFPLMLTASFSDALIGIRNAFVNRLNGRVEAVRLKISIIEFLSTCIETQPGIIESFTHLTKEKNKETVIGRFSCLTPMLNILLDKKHIDVLSSSVLEFFSSLWMTRHDVAMEVIKKRKGFWGAVIHPLSEAESLKEDKATLEVLSHSLRIAAIETYYVRSERFDEELKNNFEILSDGKCYSSIGKFILPPELEAVDCPLLDITSCKLTLAKSWKMFLSVMLKFQGSLCGLSSKSNNSKVLNDAFKALVAWLKLASSQLQNEMLVELSDICWMLCYNWKSIVATKETAAMLIDILNILIMRDEVLLTLIQLPLFSIALLFLQQKEVTNKTFDDLMLALASVACRWMQLHGDLSDLQQPSKQSSQTRLVIVKALGELILKSETRLLDSLLREFKECGIVNQLLYIVDQCLQKRENLEFAEVTLTLFLACSQREKIAEHLSNSGMGKFICLSVRDMFVNLDEKEKLNQDRLLQIWCLLLGITGRLLQVLKYAFVETAIDFVGTHKEALAESMKIVQLVVSGHSLHIAEQVSFLFYELTPYEADIAFALPNVFVELKYEVIQMAKISIALLARQKILSLLIELKPGDDVNQIISQTKTASPPLLRSDSTKSSVSNEAMETPSRAVEVAHNKLLNILCNCVIFMRRLTPDISDCILDEGMDMTSFMPLLDLSFKVPSLDNDSPACFGTLVSCLNLCIKMVQKASQSEQEQLSSEKDFHAAVDEEKRRSCLWLIIENALIVLMSQASCYLRHPGIDDRQKNFLKREFGSELSNFLYAVHRCKARRGIPPSPISDKLASSSVSTISMRRSPSKLSTSFSEDDDNSSLFRFVDSFAKTLQR